jgi:hypothetical protein
MIRTPSSSRNLNIPKDQDMSNQPPNTQTLPAQPNPNGQGPDNYARRDKVLGWFGQVIIPLLLGSFLFTGILEGYKSSLGDKKDIIDSYYRPMRALQASCSSQHHQLVGKYGELAGNYQLQFNELAHMQGHPELNSSPAYGEIPKAIWTRSQDLAKATPELARAVAQCSTELYIKYEELALVTGTYKKFKVLAKARDEKHTDINRRLQESKGALTAPIEAEDMMGLLRKLVATPSDKPEEQQKLLNEVKVYAETTIKAYEVIGAAEGETFDTERDFFKATHDLFAEEISARQSKGFFSYFF